MTWEIEVGVTEAVRAFLAAFENLDWDRFIAAFAEDAVVFHPDEQRPQGFRGRAAVEASWRPVFDEIREKSSSGPPYHSLPPESLRVQILGANVALASFELKNEQRWGRRTLVLNKRGSAWKIVHLHASNFSLQP
jgi:ketosteroid isomerase-like protein